jgi:hypothetical protein
MLGYFSCAIGNIAETRSSCSSRSDGNTLRVWFSCSPFVPSEHGVKMTAPQEVYTKDTQHAIVRFLVPKGMKGAEIHRQLSAKYRQNCFPQRSVYEFKNSRTSVVDSDRTPIHNHKRTNHGACSSSDS